MANLLSPANLLSYIQVDPKNEVIRICYEIESLRRSRKYEQAIEVAKTALALSQNTPRLFAISLLYASAARLSTGVIQHLHRAANDCDRAAANLGANPLEQSIAQILRAQIHLVFEDKSHNQLALKNLSQAAENLAAEKRRPTQFSFASHISELYRSVNQQIKSIAVLPNPEARRLPFKTVRPMNPAKLQTSEITPPVRLRWIEDSARRRIGFRFVPDDSSKKTIDAKYVMIDGRLFLPLSIDAQRRKENFRLARNNHEYFVLQMLGEPGNYVLIDKQDRPDQAGQIIAVRDEAKAEIWLDQFDFPPPYDHIHIIGDGREWDIPPTTGKFRSIHIVGGGPQILGIVEAILVPLPNPHYLQKIDLCGSDLQGVNLAGADLTGANLSGANLTNADLANTRLIRANLQKSILRNAKLTDADLTDADLDEAICDDAYLINACLDGVGMYRTSFINAKLGGAQIREAGMWGCNLSGAKAANIDLRGTKIEQCDLSGVDLTSARLEKAQLTGSNLSGAELPGARCYETDLNEIRIDNETDLEPDTYRLWCVSAQVPMTATTAPLSLAGGVFREKNLSNYDFTQANLSGSDLAFANLQGARLTAASLEEANLEGANLTRARLQGAQLNSCYLGQATLEYADLSDSDLSNAYLQGLDLRKTRLTRADLSSANLLGALIDAPQLKSVKRLNGAIMPDGRIYL